MSDDIKPGDLAVVIKPTVCCNNPSAIGVILKVLSISHDDSWCVHCGRHRQGLRAHSSFGGGDLSRLKKIPPLAELEDTTTDTPIKELA